MFRSLSIDGKVLRVGISPYSLMNPECLSQNQGKHPCDPGMELSLLSFVAQVLNFTIELVYSSAVGCGSPVNATNGNWTSLLGMLQRDEIDITGNLCEVYDERTHDFGVSWPVWQDQQAFLIAAPTAPELHFNPLAPFANITWFTMLFLSTCLTANIALEYILNAQYTAKHAMRTAIHEVEAAYFLYSPAPRTLLWVCGLFWIAAMKISFSSYIRSVLMYPSPLYAPFTDFLEFMAKLSTKEYVLLSYHDTVQTSLPFCTPTTCQDMYDILTNNGFRYVSDSSPTGLLSALQRNRNLVLTENRLILLTFLQQFGNASNFWLLPDDLNSHLSSSFMWRKDFRYSYEINQALIFIGDMKMNIVDKKVSYVQQQLNDKDVIVSQDDEPNVVTLSTIKGPLLYYLAALIMSTLVFMAEVMLHMYHQRNKQHRRTFATVEHNSIELHDSRTIRPKIDRRSL